MIVILPTQVQDLPFGLAELHEVCIGPPLMSPKFQFLTNDLQSPVDYSQHFLFRHNRDFTGAKSTFYYL